MKKKIVLSMTFVLLFAITITQANGQEDYRKVINVGNSALWVEISDDKVYVTNPTDGTIVILDENSNKVIGTIEAGKGVILLEVVKDKNKIYATLDSQNIVSVFDLTTLSKIKDINLGESVTNQSNNAILYNKPYGPYISFQTNGLGLAYNLNNEMLYVIQSGVNHVDVIDTKQDTVVGTITVGITPILIKIDQETNTGYVTNWESNDITVIDLNSNKVTGSIKVGSVPDQMAIDPADKKLYVTNHASPNISVIDLNNNSIEKTIQLKGPTHSIAFNSKNGLMHVTYVPNSPVTGSGSFINRVELIDTKTDTLVGGYDIAANPFSTAIDSDKQKLFATIFSNGTVVAVDLSTDPRYAAAVPEFGPLSVIVLILGISSIVAISMKTKFRFGTTQE
jgi:predicted secreted protein with PEFG-CTERM motif